MSLCNVPSRKCTSIQMGSYLGFEVPMRPMEIMFKLSNEKERTDTIELFNKTSNEKTSKTLSFKPTSPKYHMCNESFSYGTLFYGAKCSCKVFYKLYKIKIK
jgi:hypothetical protein